MAHKLISRSSPTLINVSAFLLLEPEMMSIGTDEHYNKIDGFALIIITKTIAMNLGEREIRNLRAEQLVSILGTIAALAALYFIA